MTDVLMTSLVVLCLAQLAAAIDTLAAAPPVSWATLRGFAVAGLLGGLATSTRYNAAAVVVAMAAAQVILLLRFRKPLSPAAWAPSLIFVAAAAAGFVAGTPYSILDTPAFAADLRYDFTHLSAAHGIDLGPGWYAHLTRSLPYGCGLLIFVAAIPGMGIAVRQSPRHGVVLWPSWRRFLRYSAAVARCSSDTSCRSCRWSACSPGWLRHESAGDGARRAGQRGAATFLSGRHRRAVAGEQRLDGRPPCAHRYADPGRAWLAAQLRPEHSVYDAGGAYVRLDLRAASYHGWIFDPADAVVRRS